MSNISENYVDGLEIRIKELNQELNTFRDDQLYIRLCEEQEKVRMLTERLELINTAVEQFVKTVCG